jgi:hypothetical protein
MLKIMTSFLMLKKSKFLVIVASRWRSLAKDVNGCFFSVGGECNVRLEKNKMAASRHFDFSKLTNA